MKFMIGSIFEDPEAVLKSRHLSDFGPASPSRIRRRRDRRVRCDYRDRRDFLSRHENLSPRDTPSHFFLTNGIKPFGLVTINTLLPNPRTLSFRITEKKVAADQRVNCHMHRKIDTAACYIIS